MTRAFDKLRARLEAEDRDDWVVAVIFCNRPVHLDVMAEDSVIRQCHLCHRDIYVAPSSLGVIADSDEGYLICCCCAELHSPEDYLALNDSGMELHSHHWEGARCVCGMTKEQFDREVAHVKRTPH